MTFNTRDLIDAGRGHLVPDYDLWDIYGDEPTDWGEVDSEDAQEAQEEAENGPWDV